MRGRWDRDDERETPSARPDTPDGGRRHGASRTPGKPDGRWSPLELPRGAARDFVRTSGAAYRLRGSEVDTLKIVGTFRSVEVPHLRRFAYGHDPLACARDLASLDAQGLIERRRIVVDERPPVQAVALMPAAQRLLLASQPLRQDRVVQQRYYSGFVKPRELVHDVSLYPMVERERAKLEAQGLRITRVVLDTELKSTVLRAWDAACRDHTPDARHDRPPEEIKRAIAEAHGFTLVGDRFQFPDVRLEVERPNGEPTHVDLELVTRHYHRGHLSLKAQAGFRFYTPHDGDVIDHILAL